jgi:hypothetical protein
VTYSIKYWVAPVEPDRKSTPRPGTAMVWSVPYDHSITTGGIISPPVVAPGTSPSTVIASINASLRPISRLVACCEGMVSIRCFY